jgi:hypothetical protein
VAHALVTLRVVKLALSKLGVIEAVDNKPRIPLDTNGSLFVGTQETLLRPLRSYFHGRFAT